MKSKLRLIILLLLTSIHLFAGNTSVKSSYGITAIDGGEIPGNILSTEFGYMFNRVGCSINIENINYSYNDRDPYGYSLYDTLAIEPQLNIKMINSSMVDLTFKFGAHLSKYTKEESYSHIYKKFDENKNYFDHITTEYFEDSGYANGYTLGFEIDVNITKNIDLTSDFDIDFTEKNSGVMAMYFGLKYNLD